MEIPWDDILKIGVAFICGSLLGIEREYRDKPAGLRTIILITVGAALFALLNTSFETASPDRIASNIVTGVGFIGAGVIFKEGLNVKGLTSAATIWVAAAIGMAVGLGNYWMAFVTLFFTLITLVTLSKLEKSIDSKKEALDYEITFEKGQLTIEALEAMFTKNALRFSRTKVGAKGNAIITQYHIVLTKTQSENMLNIFLYQLPLNSFNQL